MLRINFLVLPFGGVYLKFKTQVQPGNPNIQFKKRPRYWILYSGFLSSIVDNIFCGFNYSLLDEGLISICRYFPLEILSGLHFPNSLGGKLQFYVWLLFTFCTSLYSPLFARMLFMGHSIGRCAAHMSRGDMG